MKENYKRLMDAEIERINKEGKKPTLLLHACCAPCSSAVLELLNSVFNITLFFYNPNISPKEEFDFRLSELKNLLFKTDMNKIKAIAPEYNNSEFEEIANGLENIPEGGVRCYKCYRLRIFKAAEFAKQNGFDYVTTTLSISPHKNAQWINEIGKLAEAEFGVKYLYSDFKKGEGYKRSCYLSQVYNLYRQDYCGCKYSKKLTKGY